MPTSKQLQVDVTLTNHVRAYKFEEATLVADQSVSKKGVRRKAGTFKTLGQELADVHVSDGGSDRGAANEIGYDVGSTPFLVKPYKLKTFVSDEELDERGPIEPMQEAALLVSWGLKLRKEVRLEALATATSNNSTPSNNWDIAAATIVADVVGGRKSARTLAGFHMNTWLIPSDVADSIAGQEDVYNTLITASALPKGYDVLTLVNGLSLPKRMLGMDVIIPDSMVNTANPGLARTLVDTWGVSSYILRTDKAARSAAWAMMASKLDVTIVKWRENDPQGWWIMAMVKYHIVESCSEAIWKFVDVL